MKAMAHVERLPTTPPEPLASTGLHTSGLYRPKNQHHARRVHVRRTPGALQPASPPSARRPQRRGIRRRRLTPEHNVVRHRHFRRGNPLNRDVPPTSIGSTRTTNSISNSTERSVPKNLFQDLKHRVAPGCRYELFLRSVGVQVEGEPAAASLLDECVQRRAALFGRHLDGTVGW